MEARRDQSSLRAADSVRTGIELREANPATGPRGGTTTVTKSGMVKKNLWIPGDEAEALRRKAFEDHRSEAAIIREGLRRVLFEDKAPGPLPAASGAGRASARAGGPLRERRA